MRPTNFAMFVILYATTCLAVIRIKTTEPDDSAGLVEATVNILTSCYPNRGNAIVIGGHLPDDLIKTLWSRQLIPIVLISASRTMPQVFFANKNQLHKLQNFVIVGSSPKQVANNIIAIMNTIWWNHMGSFLIVYWPNLDQSQRIPGVLAATWKLNILYAKVIYDYAKQGRMIVVHNPYTNDGPNPWRFMGTVAYLRNHPFSIFYRRYKEDESVCENLDFDKTNDLGGYPIICLALTNALGMKKINFEVEHFYHFSLIIKTLNAMVIVLKRIVDYSENVEPYRDLRHGTADICTNPTEQYASASSIYPFVRTRLYVMTQYPGHKTQLQKILGVVDVNSRIGVGLVLFLTVLFFKCVVHQALVPSILNVLRAVCNTGFTNIPRNTAPRLFLTAVLMFVVTMQGIYQGQLASLLTTNVSLPVVNSLKDLANSDHTVYGFSVYAGLFDDPKFDRRYVHLHDPNCTKHVIRDSLAACINIESELINAARKLKFHISTEHITTLELSWLVRESWPLKEKFDKAGMSMFEADITGPFQLRLPKATAADFAVDDDVKNNKEVRVMTFKDLRFAFVILGIGLTFASITFIVEIVIDRYRP